jgi:hypothetical protein
MTERASRWHRALWAVPLLGWVFIVIGLVWPMTHPVLQAVWWIDVFLSIVVHGLQIIPALPRARAAGYSVPTTVFLTMLLGATWWRRLPPPEDDVARAG